MKMSDIVKQLPETPMLDQYRKTLESSIDQFGDQEVSLERASEIEKQVRAYFGQFELKH